MIEWIIIRRRAYRFYSLTKTSKEPVLLDVLAGKGGSAIKGLNLTGVFRHGDKSPAPLNSTACEHLPSPDKGSVFKAYYEGYYKDIFKHVAFLTGNPSTAEDICQETFLRLYDAPPQHSNVLAWLRKVATNLSYNYMRDQNSRRSKDTAVMEDEPGKVVSIEDAAIKNMEMRVIRKVLNSLPPRDRICLMLKFSGYKYAEIAEIIDVEASSVGTILARSQAKFKEIYSKEVR